MRIARFAIRSSLPIGSGLLLVGLLAAGMLAMASRETPAARAQGPGLITHTTVADFQAPCAISSNISVGNVAGGELHLTASVEDDFDGATVDTTRWITDISNPAAGPTQSLLIANGRITLNGVYLRSVLTLTQLPRFFEARARLMQAPNTSGSVDLGFYRERGPLYNPPSRTSSIRLFILGNGDPNNLIVRARDDGGDIVDVDIPDPDVTQFHVFRIEWEPGATRYYIDGSLATVIPSVTTVVTSWVFLYHQTPISYGTTPMDIDWVRAGQYALNGTYTSCPQDAGQQVQWTTISWDATVTGVTALAVRVRTSSDGVSWSSWSNPLPSGPNNIPAALAFARYLQYRVEMTTTNPMFSPEVREIAIGYNELADLAVSKSAAPDPVLAGEWLTYTIRITNNGPLAAAAVRVTDTLPGGVTLLSASASQGTCSGPVCDLGTLAAGATAVVTLSARMNANTPAGPLTNTVVVWTNTPDDPANNTATATTTIQTQADLAVAMADDPDPVIAGNPLTYTVQVTNAGPSDAQNTRILLTLPDGLTILGFAPSQGSCTGTTCNLGTLPAGSTATVVVRARVNPSVPPGTSNAQAQATTDTTDPNPNNNTATATTTIQTQADLAVAMADDPDPVIAGNPLTYTVQVTNAGPSDAQNTRILLTLPDGLTILGFAPSQGSCTGTTCNLGTLPAGSTATVVVRARVNPSVPPGTSNAQAQATTDTTDPNPNNNTATATTTIQTQADLAVAMADDPDPVIAGNPLTYTVQVTNAGPSDAQNTRILLTLPDGLTILGFAPSQGSCTGTTCNLGTLPAGSTATVVVRARVNPSVPPGTSNAQAQATTDTTDPNPNNNTATATTTIQTQADLAVAMADDPDPVIAGNPLTYTVQVTNAGPSDAQNTRILLTLPDGLTILGFAPSQGSCTGTTCNLGTLPAGSTATVVVRARVNPSVPPGTSNAQAQATTDTTDPNPNNNTATATTTIQTQADLAVAMADDPDPVIAGNPLTYTVQVTNAGPSDAQNTRILLTLPDGLTILGFAPSQGSCTGTTCNLGTLPAGSTATVVVRARVNPSVPPGTSNAQAQATTDTTDPNPNNNTATATTTVTVEADLHLSMSGTPDRIFVGEIVTYTLVVTNAGPSAAPNATISFTLPAGMRVERASSLCSVETARCNLGTLPVGGEITITLEVRAERWTASTVVMRAEARSDGMDPTPATAEVPTAVWLRLFLPFVSRGG